MSESLFAERAPFGYFGIPHTPPDETVPTPVGKSCMYCAEPIVEGEQGLQFATGYVQHRECGFRSVAGSVGHLKGRCTCFGGDEGDPPDATRREGAIAAWEWALKHNWFEINRPEGAPSWES